MNLAIGFFDGVHRGHRRILSQADMALTFAEHPLSVLAPERAPALLMTFEERLASIRDALRHNSLIKETEKVRALHFTPEFAAMPPAAFAAMLKRDYPDLETIYCGPNWNFGAGGSGNASFLINLGFDVRTVPFEHAGPVPNCEGPVPMGERVISSTRIRSLLASGGVKEAAEMLGRWYTVQGEVRRGKGRGTELGFPTVNLHPVNSDLRRLLPFGVYVVDSELGRGIANWGLAPTMGSEAWTNPVFEVYVIDAVNPILPANVPASISLSVKAYLRPERKFDTLEALKNQITDDIELARRENC